MLTSVLRIYVKNFTHNKHLFKKRNFLKTHVKNSTYSKYLLKKSNFYNLDK